MTQEEKDILLKYLCMALPYGVMVQDDMGRVYKLELGNSYLIDMYYGNGDYVEAPIKPYLRPMSSMTEEEKKEYELLANRTIVTSVGFVHLEATELIEWLTKKHFDFMGLIPKELALNAEVFNPKVFDPEVVNPYKE